LITIIKIRYSGRNNRDSIVVVLMGDGFTATQQLDFLGHAHSVINTMLGVYPYMGANRGIHPFNLFREYFTVYAIKTISEESGISIRNVIPNVIVNNRFGSYILSLGDIRMSAIGLILMPLIIVKKFLIWRHIMRVILQMWI